MSSTDGFRADWAQKDFYKELGLTKDATKADIKKAYRALAKDNHPDSHPDDTARHEKFKAVAEAYDVLGDDEKRKKYDEMRSLYGSGFPGGYGRGGGQGGGFGGFDLSDLLRERGGSGGGGIGDMFGDIFGGGGFGGGRTRAQARAQKGADVETSVTISFTDALGGVTLPLRLSSDAPCPDCSGTGGKPGTKPHICPECEGAGFVVSSVGGAFSLNETCPTCAGRQLLYDQPCPACQGSGRGMSSRTIQARVPAGVKDGQRIRLKGKGSAGVNGGPAGDLFVDIKVGTHPVFGRKGDNLTIDVPVSIAELALGGDIRIPTLSGTPVTLKVPAGTPSGRTFRVRGRGARRKDGTPGDLLATVLVQIPQQVTATEREALETLGQAQRGDALRVGLFGGVT